jgi:hypothetical protein
MRVSRISCLASIVISVVLSVILTVILNLITVPPPERIIAGLDMRNPGEL